MKKIGVITVTVKDRPGILDETVSFDVYDQVFCKNPNDPFTFWSVVSCPELDKFPNTNAFFLVIGKAVSLYNLGSQDYFPVDLTEENLAVIKILQDLAKEKKKKKKKL